MLHDAVINAVTVEQVRSLVPIPDPGPFSVDFSSCPYVCIGFVFVLNLSLYLNRANLYESLYIITANFKSTLTSLYDWKQVSMISIGIRECGESAPVFVQF